MIDPKAGFIQRMQARVRRHLLRAGKQFQLSRIRFREFPALRQEDMPWYPDAPQLTPEELRLLHNLRRELGNELAAEETIDDCDVVQFALQELRLQLEHSDREDVVLRLLFHLQEVKGKNI